MSDECKYYYYDCGYCCALKKEEEGDSSIDSDTVHKYCWGYNYENCPRYKKRNSSGGCFLTTACIKAKGLPDNCHELTVLRSFRDNYMRSLPNGEKEIKEYYHCAPKIVASISEQPNAQEIWEKIYTELVLTCVSLIEEGKKYEAYIRYKEYTKKLERMYTP